MDVTQTLQSQRFTFGEAQDTQYISYDVLDTKMQLPYNPFAFDLQLTITKSQPSYEPVGTIFFLSRQKTTVFCRKKKKEKVWTEQKSIPIYLNAEIISQHHFSIDTQYELRDLKSRHGTFVWVDNDHPLTLELNDKFLIGKELMTITVLIQQPKPFIEFTYKDKTYRIEDHTKLFLIGSHKSCNLVVPSLYQFQVCINPSTMTIFTNLDEQQACWEHGLWYKLRTDQQKHAMYLEHGSLIMADPYIFKVTS